jgi:hypothetical protein
MDDGFMNSAVFLRSRCGFYNSGSLSASTIKPKADFAIYCVFTGNRGLRHEAGGLRFAGFATAG